MGLFDFITRKRLGKDLYAEKTESIDDINIGRVFETQVKAEMDSIDLNVMRKYTNPQPGIITTRLSQEQVIELAKRFFASLDDKKARDAIKVIEGKNKRIKLNIEYGDESNGNLEAPHKSKKELPLNCKFVGDLRDLYVLIHEVTHTLDIRNGDHSTRRVLGEIAPQCMELLVDDFLLGLEDKGSYGIDGLALKQDINTRKIIRFLERYRNTCNFNKDMRERKGNNREKDSRYMLAQVYQAEFARLGTDDRKRKIFEFIRCVENDKFEKANEVFGMEFPEKTTKHIRVMIEDIKRLLPKKRIELQPVEKTEGLNRVVEKVEEK